MDNLSHYLRPPTHIWRALVAGIAAAALLVAVFCFLAFKLSGEAANAEAKGEQLRATQAIRPVEKKNRGLAEEQKKWAVLKAERDFSWAEIFAAVEKAGSQDIELLAFKPDKASRSVLLGGEARDQKALMAFLDALAAQGNLKNVHLTRQQRKKRDRLETVFFEIRASISA